MMKNGRSLRSGRSYVAGSTSLTIIASLLASVPAWAQTPTSQVSEAVVVTGTLLRGIAPTGANPVGVSKDVIAATGKTSAVDLLNSIPQLGNFNTVQAGGAGQGQPTVRPALRGLNSSGNNPTLLLLNGNRMIGVGILGTSPDPSFIPPSVLERVDVVPDGGSATYGSDAVGGVINFITKKRFDGVEINGHYGEASGYETSDLNVTVGKDWGSGSAYVSFSHAEHTNITGAERDFMTADVSSKGGGDFRSATGCVPGSATVNNTTYSLATLAAVPNFKCDQTDTVDYYPNNRRNTVYGHLFQEVSDTLRLEVEAYASQNKSTVNSTRRGVAGRISITPPGGANPNANYQQIPGTPVGAAQSLAFGFDGSAPSYNTFNAYGLTSTLIWELNDNWQVRTTLNMGRSYNETRDYSQRSSANDQAVLNGSIPGVLLNPYNLDDPSAANQAALDLIRNWDQYAYSTQEMAQLRSIADGELFSLPGGSVRLAAGVEYSYSHYSPQSSGIGVPGSEPRFFNEGSRNVGSVFGELFVPVIGSANSMPGIRALDFSVSVRNDQYTGTIGSTTNPKIGFNYKPVEDLTIRGNWGKSFNAPNLGDTAAPDTRIQQFPFLFASSPANPTGTGWTYLIAGGNSKLVPETAKTWSAGADWKVSFVPGLTASLTYWDINYKNRTGLAPFFSGALYGNAGAYAPYYWLSPNQNTFTTQTAGIRLDGFTIPGIYSNPITSPYVLIDARRNNLAQVKINGIDFNFDYRTKTSFGSMYANLGGTYRLKNDTIVAVGAPVVDNLKDGTRKLAFVGAIGGQMGPYGARLTYNYLGGYPTLTNAPQTRVKAFQTANLFFSWDLGKAAILEGTSVTLNIDNITDEDPPYVNNNTGGATNGNGSTVGRLVMLGFNKKF